MTRDYTQFPNDDHGDALWRMFRSGDDLSKPREIDFSVIFPSEEAALKFAVHPLRNGLKVSFSEDEENDEMPWLVQAHPFMLPTLREHYRFRAPARQGRGQVRR